MKKSFSNSKKLIKHLKRGHKDAYTYLVETYYDRLCDYAGNLSKDPFIAEDIVQNVLIRTWEQRDRLKAAFSIKSFLYRSVYNEFIDQYRKDLAVTALEKKYVEGLDAFFETEEDSNTGRLIALVKREIEHLPPKCKEIFLLSKQEGLTYTEIAEYQKVSIKTVESHMKKAFFTIREKLGDKMDTILFLLFGRSAFSWKKSC